MPEVQDVLDLIGRPVSSVQVEAALAVVTSMAKAYTRDVGFILGEPNEQIGAVILAATARLLANPDQSLGEQGMGAFSVSYGSAFTGWSVAELYVLNRFRTTAQ